MAFTQKLPEWNALGIEPPAELKADGWKAGMKPADAYFNWLHSRTFQALQELQQKAVEASALENKVDKVAGKGLSSNDYTKAEKEKLAGMTTITDEEKAALTGKYTKPAGGIPKTDLAKPVQDSLDKANSAVQDVSALVQSITNNTTEIANVKKSVAEHQVESMPHQFVEGTKKYKYGFKTNAAKDGLVFVYEEVL